MAPQLHPILHHVDGHYPIQIESKHPPNADILSSFYLADLGRVIREADHLPAAAYLGLAPPYDARDAPADPTRLSELPHLRLFPLARWPGPALHPLSPLQQAAVNAMVRDLERAGRWR